MISLSQSALRGGAPIDLKRAADGLREAADTLRATLPRHFEGAELARLDFLCSDVERSIVALARVTDDVPLAFAARVDRLADLALECLAVAPDSGAVSLVAEYLTQIQALAAGALQ